MLTFLAAIHVLVAILLIFFVLLQDSKGGAMGMLGGGGGGNTVFGASGTVNVLVKITRWTAIVFALTCIGLTVLIAGRENASVMSDAPAAAPVEQFEAIQKPEKSSETGAGAATDENTKKEDTPSK